MQAAKNQMSFQLRSLLQQQPNLIYHWYLYFNIMNKQSEKVEDILQDLSQHTFYLFQWKEALAFRNQSSQQKIIPITKRNTRFDKNKLSPILQTFKRESNQMYNLQKCQKRLQIFNRMEYPLKDCDQLQYEDYILPKLKQKEPKIPVVIIKQKVTSQIVKTKQLIGHKRRMESQKIMKSGVLKYEPKGILLPSLPTKRVQPVSDTRKSRYSLDKKQQLGISQGILNRRNSVPNLYRGNIILHQQN